MRDRECRLEELIFVDIRSWGREYVLMYILYKGEEMYEQKNYVGGENDLSRNEQEYMLGTILSDAIVDTL